MMSCELTSKENIGKVMIKSCGNKLCPVDYYAQSLALVDIVAVLLCRRVAQDLALMRAPPECWNSCHCAPP